MRELFEEEVFSDDWKGRRDRSIIALMYETGVRLSELIALSVSICIRNGEKFSF